MKSLEEYIADACEAVKDVVLSEERCSSLYEPIAYILDGGGKRLRPTLLLMSCEACGGNASSATKAAAGIEVFHNFTLVHDDVMDNSDSRRGRATIHKLWDENRAILCGDTMLTLATQLMMTVPDKALRHVLDTFNAMAIEIYEGQAYDVEFESRNDVTIDEYLEMIRCKTSALLGGACRIGAIIAGASDATCRALYEYGERLGLAFQIQDDYLDLYGDEETLGKPIGGDIINDKKTFLRLSLPAEAEKQLDLLISTHNSDIITTARAIMTSADIPAICEQRIREYCKEALEALTRADISTEGRELLNELVFRLLKRKK